MTARRAATVGVGAVVLDAEARLLAGWRNRSGETPCWCLPGGHVEPGESFAEAAMREVGEETGIVRILRAQPFALILDHDVGRLNVTIGVLVTLPGATSEAIVTEPAVFASWRWWTHIPPNPLFPASGHVLDAWRGAEPNGVVRHLLDGSAPPAFPVAR